MQNEKLETVSLMTNPVWLVFEETSDQSGKSKFRAVCSDQTSAQEFMDLCNKTLSCGRMWTEVHDIMGMREMKLVIGEVGTSSTVSVAPTDDMQNVLILLERDTKQSLLISMPPGAALSLGTFLLNAYYTIFVDALPKIKVKDAK